MTKSRLDEVVKKVNGYEITRMKGTQRYYTVIIYDGEHVQLSYSFRTIKAAEEYCMYLLPTRIN